MIERGQREKTSVYDDAMICPSCGGKLNCDVGIIKCQSCEYQCEIFEIDYNHRSNNFCIVCGNPCGEFHKICGKCRGKMIKTMKEVFKNETN